MPAEPAGPGGGGGGRPGGHPPTRGGQVDGRLGAGALSHGLTEQVGDQEHHEEDDRRGDRATVAEAEADLAGRAVQQDGGVVGGLHRRRCRTGRPPRRPLALGRRERLFLGPPADPRCPQVGGMHVGRGVERRVSGNRRPLRKRLGPPGSPRWPLRRRLGRLLFLRGLDLLVGRPRGEDGAIVGVGRVGGLAQGVAHLLARRPIRRARRVEAGDDDPGRFRVVIRLLARAPVFRWLHLGRTAGGGDPRPASATR
jgi:hypothetical protein